MLRLCWGNRLNQTNDNAEDGVIAFIAFIQLPHIYEFTDTHRVLRVDAILVHMSLLFRRTVS